MSDVPKFTKRVAIHVKSMMSAAAKDLPGGKYMPVIGWEVGFDRDFVPRPALGLIEVARVPPDLEVECHDVCLAYNLPDRVLATLHSSILDFDGKGLFFVAREEVRGDDE